MHSRRIALSCLAAGLLAVAVPTHARVSRIVVEKTDRTADGAYETLRGRAFGTLDPSLPGNAAITDLQFAPRNAQGQVEYVTTFSLSKPVDMAKASGVEVFESFQALNPMKNYVRIYPQGQVPELQSVDAVAHAIDRDSAYARQQLQPFDAFLAENHIDFALPVVKNPLRKNCDETWLYSLLSGDVTPCCQIKTPSR